MFSLLKRPLPMTPEHALERLLGDPPQELTRMPMRPGLYALYDHTGAARFIGASMMCIREDVYDFHAGCAGAGRKFMEVYSAGRLFHDCRDPRSDRRDGAYAERLRTIFVRRRCRAVGLEVTDATPAQIQRLRDLVVAAAPQEVLAWNARKPERINPERDVPDLLDEIAWPDHAAEAVERQNARWHQRA